MQDIEKRFSELADKSWENGIMLCSNFLNAEEQSVLLKMHLKGQITLWGGFEEAERCIAVFGEFDLPLIPIELLKIEPVSQKFAPTLTHRDFLGAVMGLGVKREMTGDILVHKNIGYMFCINKVSEYIAENFLSVGRINVNCSVDDSLPSGARPKTEDVNVIVSSRRIDSTISAVYGLPRGLSKHLFLDQKVFLNSVECQSSSVLLKDGDTVSVRGYGKFVLSEEKGTTRKDNLVLEIKKYV